MKKSLCMLLLLGSIVTFVSGQSSVVNVTMKDNKCLQDDYQPSNPAPVNKTHVYLKSQMANAPQQGSSRNVTTVPLGSSGNLFTILSSEVNRIAVNNKLNTLVFVHRSDPTFFPSSNVGQYRYDVSYDGGATWLLNQGERVLNPSGNQQTYAGRYPNTAIHNPLGNSDPQYGYMLYLGSWLPFDAGGSWDGHFAGVARLDNDTTTFTEHILTPNNGDLNIVGGLCNGTQDVFWAVNWDNSSDTELNPAAFLIFRGVWNHTTNDVDWTQHMRIAPPFDLDFDGTAQATALNLAFDHTGQYGWVSMLADVVPSGSNVLSPVVYRTTDGGATWVGPTVIDLSTFNNVVANLSVNPNPQTAFDMDIVVDANGNPHMLVVIGSSGQDYAISTGGNAGLKIYDITYVPTAANDCKWQAIYIDDVLTFRGDITAAVTEDNRPQCSASPDGKKVFFGWLDSDPDITGGDNNLPNFKTRAIDVNTGLATAVVNRTDTDPVWSGGALFASLSAVSLQNGSTYTMPTVFSELNVSGSDEDPVNFYYATDIQYSESDFNQDVFAPVITLNGSSPVTITQGSIYSDAGATALDNVDGDISISIVADVSNVNTAAVGSYVVTYNVMDSAGNTACDATRIVNVVANPDNTAPVLTLTGNSTLNLDVCDFFADPGATATDNVDGNLTSNIVVSSNVPDPLVPGTYTVTYDVTDGAGNPAIQLTRTVNVTDVAPSVTLIGGNLIRVETCETFTDPGAFALDNCKDSIGVTVSGTVNPDSAGTYTLTYTANDGVFPPVSVTRTVQITPDLTPPDFTIIGDNPAYVYLGTSYVDSGATAFDCVSGDLTSSIDDDASNVNVNVRGNYIVTYEVEDNAGNVADTTRIVVVNTEPDPDFTFIVSGGTVSFTDASLYDPTIWNWNFGDFFTSPLQNPVHTYDSNKVYNVCLKARNVFNNIPGHPVKETCKPVAITSVGINEVAIANSFDIYPNPTSGFLTLEIKTADFEQVRIELFDLVGKSLNAFELNERTVGSKYTIDLAGSPEGVYLVKIHTEKGTATKKVIVGR